MQLCFMLSMPGCPSWNGKWTGAGKMYARIVTVRNKAEAEKILNGAPYGHNWPDGWAACVDVCIADRLMVRNVRKYSQGFCGYEWMITNIVKHGDTRDAEDMQKQASLKP